VETIVVEIHNTPWHGRHTDVMDRTRNEHPLPDWRRHRFAKTFHVSPFIDMDIRYDWIPSCLRWCTISGIPGFRVRGSAEVQVRK
jgi:DUF1365 family protein